MSTTPLLLLPLLLAMILARDDIPTFDVKRANATHFIDDSFYEGAALKARGRLVYVSYPRVNNDTSVKLAWDNGGSCEFRLPRVGYLSSRAASLGDGKLVVALVERPQARSSGVGVRFYVVDWEEESCGHAYFDEKFGGTILDTDKPFDIVPYRDGFDVLAKSALHCEHTDGMCLIRYSEEGEHMGVRNLDLAITTETSLDLVSLHPLREFDPSHGYVLVSKQTSRLHVLDSSLSSLRSGKTPGYLMAHSALNGDIGICYESDDDAECAKLDSRLKFKTRVRAPSNRFGTRRIYNLLDGSSLLVTLSRGRVSATVWRLGVDGRLDPSALFRYDDCESLYTEPRDYFAELDGDVYCFSFACRHGLITHCTRLPADRSPSYLT